MARSRQLASSPHMEWTSLLEVSGPFLSPSVLDGTDGFQQGLPAEDDEGRLRRDMRNYYEQWLATAQTRRPDADLHRAWLKVVVEDMLEWPADRIAEGQAIPPGLRAEMPEHRETLQPDLVLTDDDGKPLLLMHRYPASQTLDKPVPNRRWNESPASRMAELLQRTGNRLGLVTNGEQWMLVNAKSGEPTGFATWHAGLWFEEDTTFTAFRALLGVERFFGVADDATLVAMLDRSAESQTNVTTQLGDQVRQAIELLVAAIDEADQDRHGELLAEVDDETVYEAAITVMMRLVFLLFAEDQRPPLFGDNAGLYDQHYSVSGLIEKLEAREKTSGEEVLEHQRDAWSRLLATFRLVYAGSDHPDMRQPAYGGSLFDPDRFPFLEGRVQGTSWETEPAVPLPLNNRTVLHMLQAIQFLEVSLGRHGQTRQRLSFRALDVEQIGHVYEQLLEHTAVRADGPALGLTGRRKKGAGEPEVSLADLEAWREKGEDELLKELKDVTNRSVSALRKALNVELDALQEQRLLVACDSDRGLYDRVRPFAGIVRHDRAGRPLVFRAGGLYVTAGSDRATTGAHYTPRSLTESIVQHALEPLVYDGPADGKPREDWQLISPKALLELKVCDPAMGSGAFLVQACRFLSERLVEAWDQAEARMTDESPVDSVGTDLVSIRSSGKRQSRPITIAPDGSLSRGRPSEQILPQDPAERLAIARRLVVDHCLYGVDVNPLAVDMAKLSLWLVTLQKDRPFTFIDHRLRCGDSLLGIGDIEQLRHWNLQGKPDGETWRQTSWFHQQMKQAIERAVELRRQIETMPELDVHDSERKAELLEQAEQTMGLVKLGADLLIGSALHPEKKRRDEVRKDLQYRFSLQVDAVKQMVEGQLTDEGKRRVSAGLAELRREAKRLLGDKRPFHWPLEFPEVFLDSNTHTAQHGFSAMVGNPPFLGGQKLTGAFGTPYRDYLVDVLAKGQRGSADLCAYFLLRCGNVLMPGGQIGVLATNTIAQGDTSEVGLDALVADGFTIPRAIQSQKWPGAAGLEVAHLWLRRGSWQGGHILDHQPVNGITPYLTIPGRAVGHPHRLVANAGKSFQGSIVLGKGFVLVPEKAQELIEHDPRNRDVLFPYLNGEDLNSRPDQSPSRWVINFHDWPLDKAREYPAPFWIVENQVKPQRMVQNDKGGRQHWWRFLRPRPELYSATAGMGRVLVTSRVSSFHFVAEAPTSYVFSDRLVVFALEKSGFAAILNSSIHEAWAHRPGATTHETRATYFPSDAFDTFPFPSTPATIVNQGERLLAARRNACLSLELGLTAVMNRASDPKERDMPIEALRQEVNATDAAILSVYRWDDLDLEHGFHETKQGVRYTISERARREVLDRLLELNHQRYAEEVEQGLHEKGSKRRKKSASSQKGLF